ncbi:phosphoglycerate dehydrogenase [Flavimobilis sp. GY10621]|uniref:D-3-phosphoglycerate dehydrogenase n=1 Tax=Flavimobilis rhizosphaerae TaxID=2775421 RepID=A0ABR9DRE8_9MICO|nr:phosphoglycerate dehydrogenase [Flavimobilis rhizosphaerae]MBD9699690.1 phosphoglycerate dehydrogenase [Flavimobilis rhizosphaerae]
MPTALLLENLHPLATQILTSHGIEVVNRTGALDEDDLIAALDGVDILGIRSKTTVTPRVLEHAPQLSVIGAFCIGTNQIDLAGAATRGIATFNAPFSNTRSVVEIAIADIIALTRRLTVFNDEMHAGVWNKSASGAHEVRGRTLGIIGYGNIGTQLSVLAENLGMSVVFYDSAEKLALGNARRMASLEELLEVSDIVTLHVDGRAGNAGMFTAEHFSRMKQGSIFLNLSRGFVPDYAALRDEINAGRIVGAAVDVFPHEPKRKGDPFVSELQGLPNVILTPHTGGSTEEAQEAIGQFVATKIRDYLTTGSTTLSVNLPNLALEYTGASRIAYLHRNVPGVLAKVNQILAAHDVNIEGQLLGTRGDIGYVVTDAGSDVSADAVAELAQLEATVRLRVLD